VVEKADVETEQGKLPLWRQTKER